MKEVKERKEALQIIGLVLNHGSATASMIAENVGVSEKTIRKRISYANDILRDNDAGMLIARPKIGIVLNGNQDQRGKAFDLIYTKKDDSRDESNERMLETLRIVLRSVHRDTITINHISEELYMSPPTAAREIKECRKWLSGFNIDLNSVRNKGLEIRCTEPDYRQAMKEYVCKFCDSSEIDRELRFFFPEINIDLIRESLIWVENEWNLILTESSFAEILTYLCIATFENVRKKHELKLDLPEEDVCRYNEYNFAEKVFRKVNDHLGLLTREEEIRYLTIQILCSKVISSAGADPINMVREYDQKLRDFVKRTITVVSDVLNTDLSGDERLYEGLLNHIRALIFRLKYGQTIDTTVNSYIRENFITTLKVSWLVSTLFEEYFSLSIGDDELSYIALYIQTAIDCSRRPAEAVLVTDQNSSVTRLIHDRILHTSMDIGKIEDVTVHQFLKSRCPSAELVISLVPLERKDERILVLKDPFHEKNREMIHEKLMELRARRQGEKPHFTSVCHRLFEPDLMMTAVHYENKEELLYDMCSLLENKGYVSHEYYASVIKREGAANTAIGGDVAIPHGDMSFTNESKIVVAVLDQPIDWGDEKVDVVFLLNILMKSEAEVSRWQAFYRQFISLTDSHEAIVRMKKCSNPVELYCYLMQ